MSSIKIRKLQKKDLCNGFLLSLDVLRKSSHLKPKKANTIFDKISKNPNYIIYVAIDDGKVIGVKDADKLESDLKKYLFTSNFY